MVIKIWIGYGTDDNGEDSDFLLFSDVKLCALHAYGQDTIHKTNKLVDILKTLIDDKYYHNGNANNGYGWEYRLEYFDDSIKYKINDFSDFQLKYNIDSDEELEFNNIDPDYSYNCCHYH